MLTKSFSFEDLLKSLESSPQPRSQERGPGKEVELFWINMYTIILFVYPPKFCIKIVVIFSWGHGKSQEKLETMFMQTSEGKLVLYAIFESGRFKY